MPDNTPNPENRPQAPMRTPGEQEATKRGAKGKYAKPYYRQKFFQNYRSVEPLDLYYNGAARFVSVDKERFKSNLEKLEKEIDRIETERQAPSSIFKAEESAKALDKVFEPFMKGSDLEAHKKPYQESIDAIKKAYADIEKAKANIAEKLGSDALSVDERTFVYKKTIDKALKRIERETDKLEDLMENSKLPAEEKKKAQEAVQKQLKEDRETIQRHQKMMQEQLPNALASSIDSVKFAESKVFNEITKASMDQLYEQVFQLNKDDPNTTITAGKTDSRNLDMAKVLGKEGVKFDTKSGCTYTMSKNGFSCVMPKRASRAELGKIADEMVAMCIAKGIKKPELTHNNVALLEEFYIRARASGLYQTADITLKHAPTNPRAITRKDIPSIEAQRIGDELHAKAEQKFNSIQAAAATEPERKTVARKLQGMEDAYKNKKSEFHNRMKSAQDQLMEKDKEPPSYESVTANRPST